MKPLDRIRAAVTGGEVDRVPIALWRHFPEDDQKAASLAAAHVAFHKKYQWDFVKITPASGYYGDDWGLRASYKPNRDGVRHYSDRPVKKPDDWTRLRPLDITAGVYGRELHAISLVRQALPGDLLLFTIFSPLTIARTLSGDQALVRYLRESPDLLHQGLDLITDVTSRFAAESLASGSDGIFFATQCASTDYLTVDEYAEFGRPYDLRVLEASSRAEVRVLHIHGTAIMFEHLTDYPVEVINWHDRRSPPTLADARHRFSGCLAGGINELTTLSSGTPEEITSEIHNAIAQTSGRRLIVAAGCTIPVDVTEPCLQAARHAVEHLPG